MNQALITSIELIAPKEMNTQIGEYKGYIQSLSLDNVKQFHTLEEKEALEKSIISQLEIHLNIELDKYLKISDITFSAPPYYLMQWTIKLERKHSF